VRFMPRSASVAGRGPSARDGSALTAAGAGRPWLHTWVTAPAALGAAEETLERGRL
jgi:hypothetical protein